MKTIGNLTVLFAVLLLTGGGVTSTLHPPIKEEDIDAAMNQFLVGDWKGNHDDKPAKIRVVASEDENTLKLTVEMPDEDGKAYKPFFPLVGVAAKIGNRQIFCVYPDLETLRESGGYAMESLALVAGRFYLFELETRKDELTVRSISFAVSNHQGLQPIPHELRMTEEGIVINPTEDLRLFLERGQYVTEEFASLKRAAELEKKPEEAEPPQSETETTGDRDAA